MYGDAAKKENDWAFHHLPKIDRKYSWVEMWDDMYNGKVKGMFAVGMNGVPDRAELAEEHRRAEEGRLARRRRDLSRTRRASSGTRPGTTPEEKKQINTTVYRLPCAGFAEKDGSFINSARWLQWKNAALPPPGDTRLDQDILAQIFLKVRDLYKKDGGKFPDPILNLRWPYTQPEHPSLSEVAREINGQALADVTDAATGQTIRAGQQLPGLRVPARRRHHAVRQLAVQRLVDRSRQPDGAPRDRGSVRPRHLSELGVVVAGEPARPLQPRVVRRERTAVGRVAAAGLVERRRGPLGRQRRARLQGRLAARPSTWARSS